MWGGVWQPTGPTLPPIPDSYCSFVGWIRTAFGWLPGGWGGDGDFTFNFTPLWSTDFSNGTDRNDFWNSGWVTEQPSEFSEKPVDLIGSQYHEAQRFHCEAAMYGRENSGPDDCEAAPRNLLPGWNERSGWSVLINGRPVEGRLTVVNPDDEGKQVPQLRGRTRRADGRTACKHPRKSDRRRRRRRRSRRQPA